MRFAYADPPYLGCCGLYDHRHESPFGCWDELRAHQTLIHRLEVRFPDGWAMSLSSPSLQDILPMCPPDVRVAAWVKPFCAFKRGVRPAYAWEPVIFKSRANPPHRPHAPPEKGGKQNTPKDFWLPKDVVAESITLKKGLTGAKPEAFCWWVLDLLNFRRGDELVDLFPGTGIMGQVVAQIEEGAA